MYPISVVQGCRLGIGQSDQSPIAVSGPASAPVVGHGSVGMSAAVTANTTATGASVSIEQTVPWGVIALLILTMIGREWSHARSMKALTTLAEIMEESRDESNH